MTPIVMIPTVGRVVWYYPGQNDPLSVRGVQPLAAHVCRVWSDRMVNLMVIDPDGNPTPRTSVPLVRPGDEAPGDSTSYCSWMPYQVAQAQKAAP